MPANTPLLVHVHGLLQFLPEDFYPFPEDERIAAVDANVGAFRTAAQVDSLFASINGMTVPDVGAYEQWSGILDPGPVLERSIFNQFGLAPGAAVFPSSSVSWYLMIDGLPVGDHVLHFGGTVDPFTTPDSCCDGGWIEPEWIVDVTANIRAVPEPGGWMTMLAGIGILGSAAWRRRMLAGVSA